MAAKAGVATWTPPPPDVWNPYEKDYGELRLFRHGTAFSRRYAPRWPLHSARLSPDAKLLVTASADKFVTVHNVETGKQVQILRHPDRVNSARFSPDGERVCTACDDCFARVFSLETGEKVQDVQHRSRVTTACFSPDSTLLCTGSKDKTARIFCCAPRLEQDPEEEGGDESPSSTLAARLQANKVAYVPDDPYGDDPDFLPGGRWGRLGEWKRAALGIGKTKVEEEEIPIQEVPRNPDDPPIMFNLDASVSSATFDKEGKLIIVGTGAARFFGAAVIFDMETQEELIKFESHEDAVTSVELSPDGKLLYTASRDKTARIFSLEDKREISCFRHPNWVNTADPTADKRWICTACDDGYARVWDVRYRKELVKLAHDGPVTTACFGPPPSEGEAPSSAPTSRFARENAKPPPLPVCTASQDGVARLFGVKGN